MERDPSTTNPSGQRKGKTYAHPQEASSDDDGDVYDDTEEVDEDGDFVYLPITEILDIGLTEKDLNERQELENRSNSYYDEEDSDNELMVSEESEIKLPRHRRCACHTIHLIATTDVNNIKDQDFRKLKMSTDAKLKRIWNKQARSSVSKELIKDSFGELFVLSVKVRWNTYYDAIKRVIVLMKKKPDKFQNLFEAFKIPKLRQVELDYLDEYVRIMKPLTEALDTMQNEENRSIGCTLPVQPIESENDIVRKGQALIPYCLM